MTKQVYLNLVQRYDDLIEQNKQKTSAPTDEFYEVVQKLQAHIKKSKVVLRADEITCLRNGITLSNKKQYQLLVLNTMEQRLMVRKKLCDLDCASVYFEDIYYPCCAIIKEYRHLFVYLCLLFLPVCLSTIVGAKFAFGVMCGSLVTMRFMYHLFIGKFKEEESFAKKRRQIQEL